MRVTVLGTGAMGAGVAGSLLRAGHETTVWNRSREKAEPLAGRGAIVAETAAQAVQHAEVVLVVLFDADAVCSVLESAASAAPAGAVWVQCATVGLDGTRRIVELGKQQNLTLVEAMMLGTKGPAEQGTLTLLAAGGSAVLDGLAPVFDAIGSKTVIAGSEVGAGTALKLAANAWIASITAATAQSIAIARALGLDPQLFLEAIDGTASDSQYAHIKGASMISGSFAPAQFALDGLRKDVDLIGTASAKAGVPTVLLDAIASVYARATELGHGADDIAAVATAFSAE